jgi:hypothetical protein
MSARDQAIGHANARAAVAAHKEGRNPFGGPILSKHSNRQQMSHLEIGRSTNLGCMSAWTTVILQSKPKSALLRIRNIAFPSERYTQ